MSDRFANTVQGCKVPLMTTNTEADTALRRAGGHAAGLLGERGSLASMTLQEPLAVCANTRMN